jgi:hypothetical protein
LIRRSPIDSDIDLDLPSGDLRLRALLDDIEQEETPERLLKLARELQQQLALRRQRQTPN